MSLFDNIIGNARENRRINAESQARKMELVKKYGIVQDKTNPNHFFVDSEHKIFINTRDPASVQAAEKKIQEFTRNPTIVKTDQKDQARYSDANQSTLSKLGQSFAQGQSGQGRPRDPFGVQKMNFDMNGMFNKKKER